MNLKSQISNLRGRWSFTLMEMMVVVAIVMILAGLTIPTIGYAKTQAKMAKARGDMSNLRIALQSFYHEYGYWPTTPSTSWVDLATMLNGNVHPYTGAAAGATDWASTNNPRGIRFFEMKKDHVGGNGTFLDPWGTGYCVLMDHGGNAVGKSGWSDASGREDGQVRYPSGTSNIQSKIAIYSYGPNGTDNSGGGDDLKTWN